MKSLTVLGLGVVITMGCDVFEPGLHGSAPAVRSTAVTLPPAATLATPTLAPAPTPAPAPAPAPTLAPAPTPTPPETTNDAPSVIAPIDRNVTVVQQAPAPAPAPAPPEDVELFELGFHHGGDVPESIGSSDWLALCEVGGAFELTKVALTVEPVKDLLLDDGEELSGRQVSAKGCSAGVVLLHGRGLVAGPVRQLKPKAEAARSVLTAYPNATIVWAGDLDRDGGVDFLVRENVDSRRETTLFLSSFSPPGEDAVFAATTASGGC